MKSILTPSFFAAEAQKNTDPGASGLAHLWFFRHTLTGLIFAGVFFLSGCKTSEPPPVVEKLPPPAIEVAAGPKIERKEIRGMDIIRDIDQWVPVNREFRAAWIATVANLDWPSHRGLPVEVQKEELRRLLDRAAALNLNAVIFQVRPAADAFYDSPYEPWSVFLTGEMGKSPDPYYDPLEFAVQEAHKRGLELHAWFNPYRAGHTSERTQPSPDHISNTQPEYVVQYGGFRWLDPGHPEASEHSRRVILDVVERYDIDGVHLDDYFYPYPSYANGTDFPDGRSWQRALAEGVTMSRDDWRRNNVNRFIEQLYHNIKALKPHVKFGISPIGVWRPGHPPGTSGGFDAYREIYADSRRWLQEGWLDYFSPQLYQRINSGRPFPVMLEWWEQQNLTGRHIWPGLFTSRVGSAQPWPAQEITGQVGISRGHPGVTGSVHFRMQSLLENPDQLSDHLAADPYAEPALIPASPWLSSIPPFAPHATTSYNGEALTISIEPAGNEQPRWWILRSRTGDLWEIDILPGSHQQMMFMGNKATVWPDEMVLSAVDRFGNESPGRQLFLPFNPLFAGEARPVSGGPVSNRDTSYRPGDKKPDPKGARGFFPPTIVKRTEWGAAPGGVHANAVRRNLAPGDTLRFRDLTVVLKEMQPGTETRERFLFANTAVGPNTINTARIILRRYDVAEELVVPAGKAFNWNGYHIGLIAVNPSPDVLAGGLAEVEIGTVASLSALRGGTDSILFLRAVAMNVGDATQRLRVPHNIVNITLHHTGSREPLTADEDPVDRLQGLYRWGAEERNWWDVPYHYLIGLDGTIYEGRDARYAGETNTAYDPGGHLLISVIGNYNLQEPTPEQIEAIADLMAWTVEKYNVPVEHIYGHNDWADTNCPGEYLRPLLDDGTLKKMVEERLSGE